MLHQAVHEIERKKDVKLIYFDKILAEKIILFLFVHALMAGSWCLQRVGGQIPLFIWKNKN